MNFWKELKRPILVLAPMADVTDSAFRHVISKNSDIEHVTYTEFVSADGLCLAQEKGRQKLLKDLEYSEIERPIVAQFFTASPERMEKVAKLALEMRFDGVDINMGCPDKTIEKQGAGAGLIKNPKVARELIRAAKLGATRSTPSTSSGQGSSGQEIPVSVKTRIGYNKDEIEEWIPEILAEKPEALIVHLRTRKEMSKVPAHWDRMKRILEIRDEVSPETLIIGNGDVQTIEEARQKYEETGCDGVMLGRAVFGNPLLFAYSRELENKEILSILKEHIELFHKNLGGVKSFAVMKKHFKSYLSGLEGVHGLKDKLMQAEGAEEAVGILNEFLI